MSASISSATARRKAVIGSLWVLAMCLATLAASAQAIRNSPGFRRERLDHTDDGFSRQVSIGFAVNFFGRNYSSLYVNNNGNVTFEGPLALYTPFGLGGSHTAIIAAFFADVDTSAANGGDVYFGNDSIDGHNAFGVDYIRVGYFSKKIDRLNSFQLILIDRSDTGPGNFDIEFNYGQVAWDTGAASRNVSAVVGFSNGTRQSNSLYELAGSMQPGAFLDNGPKSLIHGSLNSTVPGRYIFQARSGTISVLRITTPPQLPEGTAQLPYSFSSLRAEGGTRPYRWTPLEWPQDLGLHLDPSTGVLSGTPLRAGTFRLPVQVNDSAGTSPAVQTFLLDLKDGPPALIPFLIEPAEAEVGKSVRIVAGLHHRSGDPPLPARDLPEPLTMHVQVEGRTLELRPEDRTGQDRSDGGRYWGEYVFDNPGIIPLTLLGRGSILNLNAHAEVRVFGKFIPRAGTADIDLGALREGSESCRQLDIPAERLGQVDFTLQSLKRLPPEHRLEIRAGGKILAPGQQPLTIDGGASMELCLVTGKRAPSFAASGEPWLRLLGGAPKAPKRGVELHIRWRVDGLNFWQRWGWLIAFILALLMLLAIIYGYVRPYRFPSGLALTFVPDYSDLDQTPQPLAQWRGVRIGFYRDARAYLHPNFRVSGEARGAVAVLTAMRGGSVWVAQGKVTPIFREFGVEEWQEIILQGQSMRRGVIYRVGEFGPFFRVTTRN